MSVRPATSGAVRYGGGPADVEARNAAVMELQGLVRGLARRRRWRGIDHDDMVQAGTLALLRASETFRGRSGKKLGSYGYPAISWALDDLIDSERRNGRFRERDVRPPPGESPFQSLARRETVTILQASVADLPAHERAVIRLRFGLAGHDPHDFPAIAAKLDKSEHAVRKAYSRARHRLRDRLAPILDPREERS